MTDSIKTKMKCPSCGQSAEFDKFIEIDVDDTPEIRAKILDMSFFSWSCPMCRNDIRMTYPLCYRDEEHKILLFYVPNIDENAQYKKEYPSYRARIVNSPDNFREKITCFEKGFDDRAIELLKLLLKSQYEYSGNSDLEELFFYDIDENGNQIFIMVKENGIEEKIAVLPIYYLNILDQLDEKLPEPTWECLLVDEEYAKELTEKISQ